MNTEKTLNLTEAATLFANNLGSNKPEEIKDLEKLLFSVTENIKDLFHGSKEEKSEFPHAVVTGINHQIMHSNDYKTSIMKDALYEAFLNRGKYGKLIKDTAITLVKDLYQNGYYPR